MSVHPHARGEHVTTGAEWSNPTGSSPRAWGTPSRSRHGLRLGRFIPTRVGNTALHLGVTCPHPVHPHARGEHLDVDNSGISRYGSSPRAWGTPMVRKFENIFSRFIPTRVGNTVSRLKTRSRNAVHPHARGEHIKFCTTRPCRPGSSPRAWGTLRAEKNI